MTKDRTSRLILPGQEMRRRSFLAGATALGVGATALPGGLRAQEPQRGGTLRAGIAEGGTTDSLDPQTYTDIFMMSLGFGTHNTLTEINPAGELVGDAAESFEASPDAQEWTFRLHQGIEFSDGRPLTADDVIASINHHRGEDTKSAAKDVVAPIADIVKVDDRTVRFVLNGPNADFPYLMADYHLLLMPANEDGTANWEDYIGTGGYVLESYEPGVRASMTRRDDYWKENRAFFDAIELTVIADTAARMNAVVTGEVDVIQRVDLNTLHLLQRRPGVRVEEETGYLHYATPMITTVPPFDNNDMRLALKLATDRQELLDKILLGHGVLGNDHPIAPTVPCHADLEQRTYDPEQAAFHAKKAGYDGEELVLHASDAAYPGAVDASTLMQEQMAKAGINVRVQREPADGYWSNVWMVKPWSAVYWGGRPTCDWMFSQAYAEGAAWNDTFWTHERFNEMLVEARGMLDADKRHEMYAEMQEIIRDQGGALVWGFANFVYAMQDKVKHFDEVAANWELDGARYVERWWFDEA